MSRSRIDQFLSERGTDLQDFFHEAVLNGYGSNSTEASVIVGTDGGAKISFSRGDWEYVDEYFDGEPHAGMTHVAYKGRVVFVLNYAGAVKDLSHKKKVYECLHAALAVQSKEQPWRGPNLYIHPNGLQYICDQATGTPPKIFTLEETIIAKEEPHIELYSATFHGRIINLEG